MPKTMSWVLIASTYVFWFSVFGLICFLLWPISTVSENMSLIPVPRRPRRPASPV